VSEATIPWNSTPPLGGFAGGSRRNIATPFGKKKLEWWGYPIVKKIEDIYNGLDTIPACDRQTDRRTDILPRHIRAMHTRRIVKIGQYLRKLCSNERGSSFFTHSVQIVSNEYEYNKYRL